MAFELPVTGTNPKATTKQWLEAAINAALAALNAATRDELEDAIDDLAATLRSYTDSEILAAELALGVSVADVFAAAESANEDAAAADSSAAASLGSAVSAQASAESSGDVAFYDTKAAATSALAGLPANQVVEVFRDESRFNGRSRYRKEASSLVIKLDFSLEAVPSVAALKTVIGMYDGQVARVVSNRQFGHFKWTAGNLSALVTADPYGGIYVAPTASSSGTSGAWVRQVEKGEYDAEWWLPDAMPAAAQTYLNSIFNVIPATAHKLIMPRREVTVTNTTILKAGIEYDGHGRKAPFNGGGGAGFFPITIAASNAKLFNISSGNVIGTAESGEPGGFHISDGLAQKASDGIAIENVSARDCHAFDARSGFRVGFKSTAGEGGEGDPSIIVYGTRDTYLENFHGDGIGRIGIEMMRGHGMEVVGGVIRMALDDPTSGIKRGTRLVGCHNATLLGTRFIGIEDIGGVTTGVSVEPGGQDGGLFGGGSGSGSQDITCEGVVCENCYEDFRAANLSRNLTINGCKGIGRTDGGSTFLRIDVADDELFAANIAVSDNQSVNRSMFLRIGGEIRGLYITGNKHIGNANTGQRFAEIIGTVVDGVIRGNRSVAPNTNTGGTFRYQGMPATADLTIDDNEFTPDSAGGVFIFTGDGTIRMTRRDSNRILPTTLWAQIRPALDQEVYV